jgi:uncharacterized membrane protein HdeD (DUF308 family)
MKPLLGLLLVVSGVILAIPQIYDALKYLDIDRWPLVQGTLGITCIAIGMIFLIRGRSAHKKTLVEVR